MRKEVKALLIRVLSIKRQELLKIYESSEPGSRVWTQSFGSIVGIDFALCLIADIQPVIP